MTGKQAVSGVQQRQWQEAARDLETSDSRRHIARFVDGLRNPSYPWTATLMSLTLS